MVTRSHSWSLVVTRGHSWSLVVTRGHSWSLVVTRGHSQSLGVTRGHSWSLVVTRGHSWSLVVTRGHSWSLVVTRGHSWSLASTFRPYLCWRYPLILNDDSKLNYLFLIGFLRVSCTQLAWKSGYDQWWSRDVSGMNFWHLTSTCPVAWNWVKV